MFSYADLQGVLCDAFSPVIALESSKGAETVCKEAGLSVMKLLRPFASSNHANYTLQFESREVTISRIAVNLEYTSHMKAPDSESIQEELTDSVTDQEPSMNAVSELINNIQNKDWSPATEQPWLLDYLSALLECYRYGENDCLYHPLAVILVASSTDPDPIRRFDELSQRVLSRKFFSQGMYSKAIPFFYFLLHDASSSANVDEIFHNMKATFNSSLCKVIQINSLPPHMARSQPPAEYSNLNAPVGLRFSDSDLQGMHDVFHSILNRNVLQNLSKLISVCTQEVINNRRGIANALFGWFRSSSSVGSMAAMSKATEELMMYHSETIEFRIRFVADIAFLVKDYETAAEYYKLVMEDYRTNNTTLQIGQASLMLAISLFLLGSQPGQGGLQVRDISYYLQQAVNAFQHLSSTSSSSSSISSTLSPRSPTITPSSSSSSSNQHIRSLQSLAVLLQPLLLGCREIASRSSVCTPQDQINLLLQHTHIPDCTSALFMTWAGLLQLQQHQRSGLFTLVQAALRWKRLGFLYWAIWCNLQGVVGRTMKGWGHLAGYLLAEIQLLLIEIRKEHINNNNNDNGNDNDDNNDNNEHALLGPSSFTNLLSSLQHYSFTKPSPHHQFTMDSCWSGVSSIVMQGTSLLPTHSYQGLNIPYLQTDSIRIRYQENRGESDPSRWPFLSVDRAGDDRYASILEAVGHQYHQYHQYHQHHQHHHDLSSQIPQWHEAALPGGVPSVHSSIVEVGQPICVECCVQNPLNEAIFCSNVHILVTSSSSSSITSSTTARRMKEGEKDEELEELEELEGKRVLAEKQSFFLAPLESKHLRLTITPTCPGSLRLTAIQFSIHFNPSHTINKINDNNNEINKITGQPEGFTTRQPLTLRGQRLHRTLEQRKQTVYMEDPALSIQVVESAIAVAVEVTASDSHHHHHHHSPYFFSELVPVQIRITNRGPHPLTKITLWTDNDQWFVRPANRKSISPSSSSGLPPASEKTTVFVLFDEKDSPLAPGEMKEIVSYIHCPEGEDSPFVLSPEQCTAMRVQEQQEKKEKEKNEENEDDVNEEEEEEEGQDEPTSFYDLHYLLLASDGQQTRMVRDGWIIPLTPLLQCQSMQLVRGETSLVRCVAENVAGGVTIDDVQMFSPCSSYHINRAFPSSLQDLSSGAVYAMIAEITSTQSQSNERNPHQPAIETIQPLNERYNEFIQQFNTLDIRMRQLDQIPRLVERGNSFVDIVWTLKKGQSIRSGYVMKLLSYAVC